MGSNLGSGLGVDHDDDARELGGECVGGDEVEDGFAVWADGGEGLQSAEAAGTTRREDDEGGGGHAFQRSTADAHVMPAPNPVSSTRSPCASRPVRLASSTASGIDALDVLP